MVGKKKFKRGLPRLSDLFGIGKYFHALVYGVNAGGDEAARALDFDHADAAGADFVDILQIAEGGDIDARDFRGFQNGASPL